MSPDNHRRETGAVLLPALPDVGWRIPLLCIVAALVLCGCGRHRLRPDEKERNHLFAEILLRQDRRDPGSDGFFDRNLDHPPHPAVARWCAIALGRIGDPATLPCLHRSLRARDARLRAAAAFAVGEIEDRSSLRVEGRDPDPRSRPALAVLLKDSSLVVRMRAIEALGKIGSPEDATRILECMSGTNWEGSAEGRNLVAHAITALMRLRNPAALPALRQLAASRDPENQWRAADALVRMSDRLARPQFLHLLASPDPAVWVYGIRGLGVCGNQADAPLLERFLQPPLIKYGISNTIAVRASAAQALGAIRSRSSVRVLSEALGAEPIDGAHPQQTNLAVQVAGALGEIGGAEAEAALEALLKPDYPSPVVQAALVGLAKSMQQRPESYVRTVRKLPFSDPGILRGKAEGLSLAGGPQASTELKSMLLRILETEPGAESHLALPAILEALGRVRPPDIDEILQPFLSSGDGVILRAAFAAYHPDSSTPKPWIAAELAYRRIAGSTDTKAKTAILQWLEPWFHEREVLCLLRASLSDRDRNVRIAAARLLRLAGAGDVPASPGPSQSHLTEISAAILAMARSDRTFAIIETNRGDIEIELYREDAPLTTDNFIWLARRGFYDGLTFTRDAPFFLIQVGDPRSGRERGPGNAIRCEINMRPFSMGSVGMALSQKDTGGSQFFIALSPQPHLDGDCTCFGHVISGMPVAERIMPGDAIERIRIVEYTALLDYRQY